MEGGRDRELEVSYIHTRIAFSHDLRIFLCRVKNGSHVSGRANAVHTHSLGRTTWLVQAAMARETFIGGECDALWDPSLSGSQLSSTYALIGAVVRAIYFLIEECPNWPVQTTASGIFYREAGQRAGKYTSAGCAENGNAGGGLNEMGLE